MASLPRLAYDRQRSWGQRNVFKDMRRTVWVTCLLLPLLVCGLLLRNSCSSLASNEGAFVGQTLVPLDSQPASILVQYLNYDDAVQKVYRPLNYTVCPALVQQNVQCWLRLTRAANCNKLFSDYIRTLRTIKPILPPPRQLDPSLRDTFLLHGFTALSKWYLADFSLGANVPIWTDSTIKAMVDKANQRQQVGQYGNDCFSIYHALDCHPVEGLTGAVFGTTLPWIEAILFAFGRHSKHTAAEDGPACTGIAHTPMPVYQTVRSTVKSCATMLGKSVCITHTRPLAVCQRLAEVCHKPGVHVADNRGTKDTSHAHCS
jgi:hypothetical protein